MISYLDNGDVVDGEPEAWVHGHAFHPLVLGVGGTGDDSSDVTEANLHRVDVHAAERWFR